MKKMLLLPLLWSVGLLAVAGVVDGKEPKGEIVGAMYGPAVASMPLHGAATWHFSDGFAHGFGASYTHWIASHIGFTGGIRLGYLYFSQYSDPVESSLSGGIEALNAAGDASMVTGSLMVTTSKVSERQSRLMLEVPLMVSLRLRSFYVNLGVAASVPLTTYSDYRFVENGYRLTAIDGLGVSLSKEPVSVEVPQRMDGNYRPSHVGGEWRCVAAAELGCRFPFDYRNAVSLAVYGRYAINRVSASSPTEVAYIDGGTAVGRPPLGSRLADEMGYYEVGLRVAYHFGVGR